MGKPSVKPGICVLAGYPAVEENRDGRHGAPGEKRKPKRKPTRRISRWQMPGRRKRVQGFF